MRKIALVAATSFNANAFNVDTKYQQSYGIFRSMGVAGAPKAFDEAAWASRIAKGMDALAYSVKNGKGAMPPKGMCNNSTDNQYKALIAHMPTSK
jgi:cytochrome c5